MEELQWRASVKWKSSKLRRLNAERISRGYVGWWLRQCEKRYIAGYEPEYEECRLKFREEMIGTNPRPLPKTPASPDFFLLVSQPRTQMSSHRASTKHHIPLPFTGTSGPAGHPFPAVFQPGDRSPSRQARHSRSVLGLPR